MNDLKLGSTDLELEDGDLVVAASREQHTALLLATAPGHWRASPLTGVGLEKFINAPATERERNALAAAIRRQMDADGLQPGIITITTGWKINIG